jgi:hypothetical protein
MLVWEGHNVEENPRVGDVDRFICAFCGLGAHAASLRAAVLRSIPLAVE